MTRAGISRRLADVVFAKAGNNKIIKGTQSDRPGGGLVQGFSASGPDVWVGAADYTQPGVVLSAVGARCGKTFLAEGAWTAIANTHVLIPSAEVDPRWLWYLTNDESFWIRGGSAQPFVKVKDTLQKEVDIPPLLEQCRIVAILDEAFEAIATAKANTEKNLLDIRALLDFTRRDMFASLADEREPTTLGRCCTFENGDRGKNYPGKEHRVAHGVPFINAGHLTEDGLDFSEMDYISEERFELLGNGKIRPRDVLFCLRGSLGKFACVDDLGRGAIASSLVILRPGAGLTTDYLLEFLASTQCAEQIERYKGGAAQPNLGAQDLKRFELPLPPIALQEATANRLASLRAAVSNAKALLSMKLTAFDELKKSLLHQAFTGQLTGKATDKQLAEVA